MMGAWHVGTSMRVEINKTQLNQFSLILNDIRLNGPKILSRTLTKAAKKGRDVAGKSISTDYNLTQKYIKSKLFVTDATQSRLTAKITAARRGVLLTHYKPKVLKRGGVNVFIRKGRKKEMPGAFATTVMAGSSRIPVIALPGKGGKYSTGNRKIDVLHAPSVSQLFNQYRNQIDAQLADYLAEQTDKEIAATMRGY